MVDTLIKIEYIYIQMNTLHMKLPVIISEDLDKTTLLLFFYNLKNLKSYKEKAMYLLLHLNLKKEDFYYFTNEQLFHQLYKIWLNQ